MVSEAALRLAGAVRAELLEVMQRIELPLSPPAFGTEGNAQGLKQALLSGLFLKVGPGRIVGEFPPCGQVGGQRVWDSPHGGRGKALLSLGCVG